MLQDDFFHWSNKDPVSFQQWKLNYLTNSSLFFRRRNIYSEICSKNDSTSTLITDITTYLSDISANSTAKCVVLLLMNMAEPAWIRVECGEKLLSKFLCYFEKEQIHVVQSNLIVNRMVFDQSCVIRNKICYLFKWIEGKPHGITSMGGNKHIIRLFEYLFHAVSVEFPPIISPDFTKKMTYRKYGRILSYKWHPINKTGLEGLYIIKGFSNTLHIGGNLFECDDNILISIKFVCDGQIDCVGNRSKDELGCSCNSTNSYSSNCKYLVDEDRKKCSFYYRKTKKYICEPYYNLEIFSRKENYYKILQIDTDHQCQFMKFYKSQITCDKCSPQFYDISKICTYQLNSLNHLIPCKSGGHLENCTYFKCNMKFKCPSYYCIPWGYVCDRKWDCPHGLDESQRDICVNQRQCFNMFKCKKSIICIHVNDICNKDVDCPFGDDEYFCDFKFTTCPSNCICLTFAINCAYAEKLTVDLKKHLPYHVIHIEACSEMFTRKFLNLLHSVTLLTVNDLFSEDICIILPNLQHSITIDLSFNRVRRIKYNCFQKASKLKVVQMNDNMISQVDNKAFLNLTSLTILNLSNNIIVLLTPTTIINCFELKAIVIQNTSISMPEAYVFDSLRIEYLISDNYIPCCFISPSSICLTSSSAPWYFSCTNLLVNNQIKMYFVVMAFIILCCNSLSLLVQLTHVLHYKSATVSTIVITFLNILDLSYGIYFLILWAADSYFHGRFAIDENEWKSGLVCFCAFSISLNFSLLYPFLLVSLAFLRFWTVMKPMSSTYMNNFFIKRMLYFVISFSIIITLSVGYLMKLFHNKIPFKICFPFLDPSNSIVAIRIMTSFIVNVQFLCVIVIFVFYFLMMKYLIGYKNELIKKVDTKKSYLPLYMQVCLVTSSNVLCWIPSGIIYLVTMSLEKYPINLAIWSTIAITPINSVINPIVFIVANVRSHKKKGTV